MTDTPTAVEVNCTTGEVTERPLTATEIAANEVATAEAAAAAHEAEVKAAADAEAKTALLAKLGITADEAKLLLA
jgi:hypothetical protein